MAEVTEAKTMSENDSSLLSQCMDYTKQLASQGKDFKFSLSLPSGFNFSLDLTQEKLLPSRIPEKKRKSPSKYNKELLKKHLKLTNSSCSNASSIITPLIHGHDKNYNIKSWVFIQLQAIENTKSPISLLVFKYSCVGFQHFFLLAPLNPVGELN